MEKYVNAIFGKLDLASEQLVHRRVAAVLTFLRDAGLRSATIRVSRYAPDGLGSIRRQRTGGPLAVVVHDERIGGGKGLAGEDVTRG